MHSVSSVYCQQEEKHLEWKIQEMCVIKTFQESHVTVHTFSSNWITDIDQKCLKVVSWTLYLGTRRLDFSTGRPLEQETKYYEY